jgi:hypothetical protein
MDGDGVISYDLNRGNQKNLSYNEKSKKKLKQPTQSSSTLNE